MFPEFGFTPRKFVNKVSCGFFNLPVRKVLGFADNSGWSFVWVRWTLHRGSVIRLVAVSFLHKLHSQTFFPALGVHLCASNAQKCWATAELLQLLEPCGSSCVCLLGWPSCYNCPENAGFHLWAEISAAVSTGSQFSSSAWLSQSQRFCSDASLCWASRGDFLSHDDMFPNQTKHHCQALFSSKAGLKFGRGEIHTFSWEPWLPCWELHLLNLEGLHYCFDRSLFCTWQNIFCQCWRISVKLLC